MFHPPAIPTVFPITESCILQALSSLWSITSKMHVSVALTQSNVYTRENPVFVELWTFTLIEGEKMSCEVILQGNEMRGEIAEYDFYQTLSMIIGCQFDIFVWLGWYGLILWFAPNYNIDLLSPLGAGAKSTPFYSSDLHFSNLRSTPIKLNFRTYANSLTNIRPQYYKPRTFLMLTDIVIIGLTIAL